jgi:hypothetical protein
MRKQCEETAAALKAIRESLNGWRGWMPQVDDNIRNLQQSGVVVGARVTLLESHPPVPQIDTPPPNWPGKELQTQGTAPGASA